ncbi:uncharacterized protein ZC3H3 isoform X2 [Periplaneta americana]|uniref:uncharacterized protein ZC3H3 isoform X2 n=1 Tax=Periplaneta americana TaxID=6978 RepID=UPI0037E8A42B
MAYVKQLTDNKAYKLQEECKYLKSLIQQYKLHHKRRETMSFNSERASRVGQIPRANASRYKKINVNLKNKEELSTDSKLPCGPSDPSVMLPVTCNLQESQIGNSLSYSGQESSGEGGLGCRSGRMYFNPHFSKLNSVKTQNPTENSDSSKLKHSVHVNPKVLAQIMKLNMQNEVTETDRNLESRGISSVDVNSPTKKYVVRSRTKLIKQNVSSRNSTSTSQFVPKKKLSPLYKTYQGPLMSVSRTKLVRAKLRRSSQSSQNGKIGATRSSSKTCIMVVKAARAVCSKYKLTKANTSRIPVTKSRYSSAVNKTSSQESKYKIDRRFYKTPKRMKKVKKYSLQYEAFKREPILQNKFSKTFNRNKKIYSFSRAKFGNRIWNNSLQPQRVTVVNEKLRRIGFTPNQRERRCSQQGSSLVRIGGVLYKTSKMKLTRSLSSKDGPELGKRTTGQNLKKSSFVVYVRGNKFLMDSSGKTLVKAPEKVDRSSVNESYERRMPVKRVDIGGVTFIQKSTNVLIRTNTHNARILLSQAKQRSIAMLTKKLRKSNQPCMFYQRFGKCGRLEKGICLHVHDPKHVAVCKKFLQGCCEITGCTLSHDVGPEKMPTCKYFLDGCCVRDNCPYLHVKVSAKAGICKNFLSGYCSDGQKIHIIFSMGSRNDVQLENGPQSCHLSAICRTRIT